MDLSDMPDVGIVAGVVAAARKQFPKIDGLWVYVATAAVAVAVAFYRTPSDWKGALGRAAGLFVGAVGGVSILSQVAAKAAPAPVSQSFDVKLGAKLGDPPK